MTVKELIETLKTCDENANVLKENDIKRFIKAEDKIWEGLGFVLQWAKYGLKK